MKKLLVGVDLSAESEHAIAHAMEIARHEGAEVVLAMIDCVPELPANVTAAARDVAERYTSELKRRLDADRLRLGELRERWGAGGVTVSQVIVDGFADEELPKVAHELGADLIIVGSHGRTGIRRWLLGSVAERVVRRADASVLVVRGDVVHGGYHRVVIGTDFSPLAEVATRRALPLLAPAPRIDLVHCWQLPWVGALDMPVVAVPHEELRKELELGLRHASEEIRTALRQLGRPEAEIHIHLVEGSPAHGVTALATEREADLLVVGSHGRRGARRFLLGSTAEVTVRHATGTVLVGR